MFIGAIGVGVLIALGLIGVAAAMRLVEDEPARWHLDLADAERAANPNDFLAATPGFVGARIDRALPPDERDPAAFLAAVERVALSEPRTARLAGSPDAGRMTFVQRSALLGFPDYITVQAQGPGRAIWSRARFGRSDLGVNRERVERWLARLEQEGPSNSPAEVVE